MATSTRPGSSSRLRARRNASSGTRTRRADQKKILASADRPTSARYEDRHCRKIVRRIRRERNMLFTFIGTSIDWHNNCAEREVCKAMLKCKNMGGGRSFEGAMMLCVLMSVYQTYRMNGSIFTNMPANVLVE